MSEIPDSNQRHEPSTEQLILMAAEAEFMQKGYAGARTTAIAEAAGVTHAMLHYYYRTKDKLFEKVVADKLSMLAETFLLSFDADRPLAESVRRAVENHYDIVLSNPLLPRFMVCEVFTSPTLMDMLADKISAAAGNAAKALQRRIDQDAAMGLCRPMNVISLFIDVISLNVFPMLAAPMIKRIAAKLTDGDADTVLDARREENVQTILRKLMP